MISLTDQSTEAEMDAKTLLEQEAEAAAAEHQPRPDASSLLLLEKPGADWSPAAATFCLTGERIAE
jgi:hypothetical protein